MTGDEVHGNRIMGEIKIRAATAAAVIIIAYHCWVVGFSIRPSSSW